MRELGELIVGSLAIPVEMHEDQVWYDHCPAGVRFADWLVGSIRLCAVRELAEASVFWKPQNSTIENLKPSPGEFIGEGDRARRVHSERSVTRHVGSISGNAVLLHHRIRHVGKRCRSQFLPAPDTAVSNKESSVKFVMSAR